MLKLLFEKYVLQQGWSLDFNPAPSVLTPDQRQAQLSEVPQALAGQSMAPCFEFLEALLTMVDRQLQVGIREGGEGREEREKGGRERAMG